jgi:hypothetical protein
MAFDGYYSHILRVFYKTISLTFFSHFSLPN